MDAHLTAEQQELRDAAARLAGDLGPGSVHDLADARRVARLEKAVAATGWRTLRSDGATGVRPRSSRSRPRKRRRPGPHTAAGPRP